jgi:hypothetical protein
MQAPLRNSTSTFFLLAVALAVAGTAHASVITNIQYTSSGTSFCLSSSTAGTCTPITSAGALTNGTSNPGSFNYSIVLADGDKYNFSGVYTGSYSESNGAVLYNSLSLTYVGTAPSVATDTIVVDLSEAVYDTTGTSYDGVYTETSPLCGTAAGSSVSGQYIVNGGANGVLPVLGPHIGAGCGSYAGSASLVGTTNPLLLMDWEYTFTTNVGTVSNASLGSTPEPAETVPAALALASLACVIIVRKRREQTQ